MTNKTKKVKMRQNETDGGVLSLSSQILQIIVLGKERRRIKFRRLFLIFLFRVFLQHRQRNPDAVRRGGNDAAGITGSFPAGIKPRQRTLQRIAA